MPIQRCEVKGKSGWKWGQSGKCYTGPGSRRKAAKQAAAIKANQPTSNTLVTNAKIRVNPLKLDPTRSTILRRDFMADMRRRFRKLAKAINELIVVENAFGLGLETAPVPFGVRRGEDARIFKGPSLDEIVANVRWQFHTQDQKLIAYREWLREQVDAGILEVSAANQTTPWLEPYIRSAYVKGVSRAYLDTRRAAIATNTDLAFVEGGKAAFLDQAFNSPAMQSKLRLLQTRAFSQLEGITAAMDQQMSRTLADGLSAGHGARRIAKALHENVSSISKKRAMVIARTEIVHAHNEGQLDAFERLDVEDVGVMAEWNTAHDGRVCPLCRPLEGIILKVADARGMIPRHPNCRCAWIPAMVGEEDEGVTKVTFADKDQKKESTFKNPIKPAGETVGQTFSKDEIDAKIRQSIRAERPGRSTAEARKKSVWTGADLKQRGSKRPKRGKIGPQPPPTPPTPPTKPTPAELRKKKGEDLLAKEKAKTEVLRKKLAATKARRAKLEAEEKARGKAAADKLKAEEAKHKAVGKEPPPHITAKGKAIDKDSKFTQNVWKEIGVDGIANEAQVRRVGALIHDEIRKNPVVKKWVNEVARLDKLIATKGDIPRGLLPSDTRVWVEAYENQFSQRTKAEIDNKIRTLLKTNRGAATRRLGMAMKKEITPTLERVRDMGRSGSRISMSGNKDMVKMLKTEAGKLPDDWVGMLEKDLSIDVGEARRGYWRDPGKGRRLSQGKGVTARSNLVTTGEEFADIRVSSSEDRGTALHELVHGVEYKSGTRIGKLENEFLSRRAAETGGKLGKATKIGGSGDEIGIRDKLPEHYCGRVYGGRTGQVHTEILSMGVEGLFHGKNGIIADKDYTQFVLGMLAGF